MVYRIFGRSGSGKSEYLYDKIKEKIEKNPDGRFDIFFVTPEQHTLSSERKILERLGNSANLRVEALSFDRMANRVSRKTGGMVYDYADSTLKKLVMNKTLRQLSPELDVYAKVSNDMSFVEKLVGTIDEMKLAMVSPHTFAAPLEPGGETGELAKKIKEVGLIYSLYEKILGEDENLRDVSNEMDYLCSLLEKEYTDPAEAHPKIRRFFDGAEIFIDSFDSFSNGQKQALSHIIDQANNVYFTFTCPLPEEGAKENFEEENIFGKTIKNAAAIAEMCKNKNIAPFDLAFSEAKRFESGILAHLEKNIWDQGKNFAFPAEKFKDSLEIFECEKIFDEAEAAAKKIMYLAREKGYRYSDIQIVAAEISSYKGILDSVFEKYKIPLFISGRTQLSTKPLMSMLLSLFDMVAYDFRLHNIQSYLKNGLCGLSYPEIDSLDIYITAWQINGFKRYAGKDWNMHPDGYVEYDENDGDIKDILAKLNETKKKFIAPVANFMKKLKKTGESDAGNVKNITSAVVDFLEEINTYERLYDLQEEQKRNGELSEAAETVQIWNVLMEVLQKLALVCGDEKIDLKRYSELFKFIISDADIGKIPTSIDEVTAINADLMLSGDKKCTIVLGLNADVFPKAQSDDDLFGDGEKQILRKYGIDFLPDSMQKSYDQLRYFYNAVASASECVVLAYRKADVNGEAMNPSMALEKVRGMYPNLETFRQDENFGNALFLLEGKENGYIEMGITQEKELRFALESYFSRERRENGVDSKNPGFKESELAINKKLAESLFCDLSMSSTKLETYVNCPFSYFCRYVLALSSDSSPKMQMNDIGRFIHKILEIFMRKIRDENVGFKDISDSYIKTETEKIIDSYLSSIIKDYEFKTDRFLYLLRRLNKIVFEIIKNLRDEFSGCDFVPADFELEINDKKSENSVDPVEIEIPNKGSLKLTGIIDRVDIYKDKKNVYIRIVDYKTGSKKFNLSDIVSGINLQMFIYLFSVWHNGRGRYDPPEGKIEEASENVPAGVLYMPSRIPQYSRSANMTEEEAHEQKSRTLARSGLFLRDEKILEAMEHNLAGRYIPVKLKPDANLSFKKNTASAVLASLEQIGKLERYVTKSLAAIAAELSGGIANVLPFKGRVDSCAYCDMRRICRFEENDPNKKRAVFFSPDKVWDIIEEET
ncbi:MAG: exodeoxyribonuclease V subunit gamma [Oscillospiraceae bacterium]|nr:exodeoxyribonuclease V subunit gamma [Oscillospiraceae bacterium]